MFPEGVEPTSTEPESVILSIKLREQFASEDNEVWINIYIFFNILKEVHRL